MGMKSSFDEEQMTADVRDLCRARQIAAMVLSKSKAEHSREFAEKAFIVYRDAADALTKVLEIV